MGDLDANGNVINNEPLNSPRLKKNTTDIRRAVQDQDDLIKETAVLSSLPHPIAGSGVVGVGQYQTVADLMGLRDTPKCTEGVEISVGPGLGSFDTVRTLSPIVRIKDVDAATGAVQTTEDAFFITPSRTGSFENTGSKQEGFFIPTNDLRRVQIGQDTGVVMNPFNNGFGSVLNLRVK